MLRLSALGSSQTLLLPEGRAPVDQALPETVAKGKHHSLQSHRLQPRSGWRRQFFGSAQPPAVIFELPTTYRFLQQFLLLELGHLPTDPPVLHDDLILVVEFNQQNTLYWL